MKKILCLLIISYNCLLLFPATPYSVETIPDVRLQDKYNHVSNPDSIIEEYDVSEINGYLNELEDSLTIEVQVVAVTSIGEEDTRDFANKLFNHWGIGLKDKDNGLLVLLVTDQREVVFETGYGLESILPDVTCFRIQQKYMVPSLKNDDFSTGMKEGIKEVTSYLLSGNYLDEYELDQMADTKETDMGSVIALAIYAAINLLIGFLITRGMYKSNKKKSYSTAAEKLVKTDKSYTLLGFGCLFFFFPFASIMAFAWYFSMFRPKLLREAKVCPQCGKNVFNMVAVTDSNSGLTAAEKLETKLGSVKHYVFKCSNCLHQEKYSVEKEHSNYKKCPACKTAAYKSEKSRVIKKATYSSTGESENTYICKFCNHSEIITESIPMLTRSSSGTSRSGGSSSSHSSSSSGSSHGGGSSGGGGSRSRF